MDNFQVDHINEVLTIKKIKMKTKLIAILLAITFANTTSAQISIGEPNCGDWIKENNQNQKETYKAWILGYMSGLDLNPIYEYPLKKIDSANQIYLWMDNYCKANPLKSLSIGGVILLFELRKK